MVFYWLFVSRPIISEIWKISNLIVLGQNDPVCQQRLKVDWIIIYLSLTLSLEGRRFGCDGDGLVRLEHDGTGGVLGVTWTFGTAFCTLALGRLLVLFGSRQPLQPRNKSVRIPRTFFPLSLRRFVCKRKIVCFYFCFAKIHSFKFVHQSRESERNPKTRFPFFFGDA